MEYLGFLVICQGVRTLNKKLELIKNTMEPMNQKGACKFIGIVNYY